MEQTSLTNISTSTVHEIPSTLDKFLIGRGLHCTLVLDDTNVSRTHCILERNNGDWYISDKSSHGTWVNGKLVDKSKSQLLASGDAICLSDALRFMYNKTSQQIADSTSEKALSENGIMDIAESEIAEAHALIAEFGNDLDIEPNAEFPNVFKVLESAREEVKQHRRELIAEREAAAAASTCSNFSISTSQSSPRPSRRRAEEPTEIGCSDDEMSDDDEDDEMSDDDEEDEDDEDDQDDCDEDEDGLSDEDDDM